MSSTIKPLTYIDTRWAPATHTVPNVESWYVTEYITITVNVTAGIAVGQPAGFGPEAVGWLLAQGWVMTNAGERTVYDYDWSSSSASGHRTFSDGSTMRYSSSSRSPTGVAAAQQATFRRIRINPKVVLKHMITEYTAGYNEGRTINNRRYLELVNLYSAIVLQTQRDLDTFDFSEADYTPLVDRIVASLASHASITLPSDPSASIALPSVPSLPTAPSTPTAPTLPAAPAIASSVTLPTAPSVPNLPSAPSLPSAPAVPETPDPSSLLPASLDSYGAGETAQINERFDELVSKAKADLTSRGLYNSTLWAATIAEIERQRAIALAEVGDKALRLSIDASRLKLDIAKLPLDFHRAGLDLYARVASASLDLYAKTAGILLDAGRLDADLYGKRAGIALDHYSRVSSARLDLYAKSAGLELDLHDRTARAKLDLYARVASVLLDKYSKEASVKLDTYRAGLDRYAKVAGVRLDEFAKLLGWQSSVATGLLGVIDRLVAVKQNLATPVKIRNDAFKAMFDFMERRTDEYPGLSELSQIVAKVGYANGGTLVA